MSSSGTIGKVGGATEVADQRLQNALARVTDNQAKPIEKYLALRDLEEKDSSVFHKLLQQHTTEVLPFVYTPTVGEACQRYDELNIQTHGLYLTLNDTGKILEKLQSWPRQDIRVIVVTDGQRILGLGDLGTGGMGISEGKILLYSAIGGVSPKQLLPICLDVGTNNENLIKNPKYRGSKKPRAVGREYDEFLREFMESVKKWRPHVFVQFEDFANHNAFVLLKKYRELYPCFNDDIQGTATIGLAGILAAMRVSGEELKSQRFFFYGAGEAAAGIAQLLVMALHKWHGMSIPEARSRCILYDSKGVVTKTRNDSGSLQPHKQDFAHEYSWEGGGSAEEPKTLFEAIRYLKPTVLIGSATQPKAFTKEIVELMSDLNERPVIFPLSNPTSKAECTFKEAFDWSKGKVVFASGSPFPPINTAYGDGNGEEGSSRTIYPAQANNAYIFPAVGHAAILTGAKSIPDDLLLDVAKSLASMSTKQDLESGLLFPPLRSIKDVSIKLIASLCKEICRRDLATETGISDRTVEQWENIIRDNSFTG
eukprot:jgi/Bigna1/127155/aug1.4_g1863